MISVGEACLLGVVQGLTEFLPVSSSGHLAVVQHFLSPLPPEQKAAVDVALHVGTLAAVILYFRRDLWSMARALVTRQTDEPAWSWIWLLALGTIPAALAGFPLKHRIEDAFDSLPLIGACFLVTGTLLFLASAVRGALRDEHDLGRGDALFIGCFQAIALLPGVSRSGSTISAGIFRRLRGEVAARYSFLLAIPAILGAVASEGKTLLALGPDARLPIATGVGLAGVTGFAAIAALLRLVRDGKLRWFAYYCWGLGVAVLAGTGLLGL